MVWLIRAWLIQYEKALLSCGSGCGGTAPLPCWLGGGGGGTCPWWPPLVPTPMYSYMEYPFQLDFLYSLFACGMQITLLARYFHIGELL